MSKVNMIDAYMHVWIRPEDVMKLEFVIPPHPDDAEPLIGFHLSLPMEYLESAQYFFTTTKTVADLVNNNWAAVAAAPPQPLDDNANSLPTDIDSSPGIPSVILDSELAALCANLPEETARLLRKYMDVCCDNFC